MSIYYSIYLIFRCIELSQLSPITEKENSEQRSTQWPKLDWRIMMGQKGSSCHSQKANKICYRWVWQVRCITLSWYSVWQHDLQSDVAFIHFYKSLFGLVSVFNHLVASANINNSANGPDSLLMISSAVKSECFLFIFSGTPQFATPPTRTQQNAHFSVIQLILLH